MKKVLYLASLIILLWQVHILFSQEMAGVQIEINAPKLIVFDAASQIFIQQGFAIINTNERTGLITTDYKEAKEAFGKSVLLSLFGRRDTEIMLSTNIVELNNKSVITILPKARWKKVSRVNTAYYEEVKLSKKSIESFRSLGEKIRVLAEQNAANVTPNVPINKKDEEVPQKKFPSLRTEQQTEKEKYIEIQNVRVKVNICNIRDNPSIQAKVIKQAPLNTEYKIIGIEGDWFEILVDDSTTGFINKSVCDEFIKSMKIEEFPNPKVASPPVGAVPKVEKKIEPEIIAPTKLDIPNEKGEKSFLLSLGSGLAISIGDWTSVYSIGFGLDVAAFYRIVDRLYIGGYFGGYYFPGKYDLKMRRLQPMFQIQYRYPINDKVRIFGGLGMGLTIDTVSDDWDSDTEAAFAFDLSFGIRFKAFYFAPRIRLVGHEGDSFGSFDFSFGYIF